MTQQLEVLLVQFAMVCKEHSLDRNAVEAAHIVLFHSAMVPWLPAVTATPSHAQTLDLVPSKQVPVKDF